MLEGITVSQALTWMKILKDRKKELIDLRNNNANENRRMFGTREDIQTPVYDVKKVDVAVRKITMEISKLDMIIKDVNARTKIDYIPDESILGEVE